MKKYLLTALPLILAGCGGVTVKTATPPPPPVQTAPAERGGSNLLSYTANGADGYIAKFDVAKDTITSQLQGMYANGQRRLKIPILFYHNGEDGIAVDSSTGAMNAHDSANLAALLALIKQIGFEEIEVQFLPEWLNDPSKWTNPGQWNDPNYGNCLSVIHDDKTGAVVDSANRNWYSENWNFIANTRTVIAAAGIPYWLDLMNEAIMPEFATYAERLWVDYTTVFGNKDTLGFSIVPVPTNVAVASQIFQDNWPSRMDVHIYDGNYGYTCDTTTPGSCIAATYVGVSKDLAAQGYTGPLLVGEVYYNDAGSAQGLSKARTQAGAKPLLWVTQWPLTRNPPAGVQQNVLPSDFSAYEGMGF